MKRLQGQVKQLYKSLELSLNNISHIIMVFLDSRRKKQLQTCIQKLGLSDTSAVDWKLLDLALTHPTI
ncbi:MAG: hypothetical protein WBM62_14560, partial [Crocosphaera sp.]